jgi:hypothetical protein
MIQYEWLLFFALIVALAVADLLRTRRDIRRAREREAEKDTAPAARHRGP